MFSINKPSFPELSFFYTIIVSGQSWVKLLKGASEMANIEIHDEHKMNADFTTSEVTITPSNESAILERKVKIA